MTIGYDTLYSKFYTIVNDPSFFGLPKKFAEELMDSWIDDAFSDPYIVDLFVSIDIDTDIKEIDFRLTHSRNDMEDEKFVIGIISTYMKIAWTDREIDSALNTSVVIGGKEEKKIQSNYKTVISRSNYLKTSLRKRIRDYGYNNNDYIGNEGIKSR